MSASAPSVSAFLSGLSPARRSLVQYVLDTLMHINPDYTQACVWNGVGLKLGSNYSCLIAPYKDHVKLMIWRGIDLDDPEERLQGRGENTRHLLIRQKEDVHIGYLTLLLTQQFALYESGVSCQESCEKRRGMAMPKFIQQALEEHALMEAYEDRPPYQRRDYVYWITSAKRDTTKDARLQQMLDELTKGNVYMKMPWGRKQ